MAPRVESVRSSPEPMVRRLGWIVAAASVQPRNVPVLTALPCRESAAGPGCHGLIELQASDVPEEVRYLCARCGEGGIIAGWREGPFDLTASRSHLRRAPRVEISASQEELAALRQLGPHPVTAAAVPRDGQCLLAGSTHAMHELLALVAMELAADHPRLPHLLARLLPRLGAGAGP